MCAFAQKDVTYKFLLDAVLGKVSPSRGHEQDGPPRRIRGRQELPNAPRGQIHRLLLHGSPQSHGQEGSVLAEQRDACLPVLGQLDGRRIGIMILGLEEPERPVGTCLIGTELYGPVVRRGGRLRQPGYLNVGLGDSHLCRKRSSNAAGARGCCRRRRGRRLERCKDRRQARQVGLDLGNVGDGQRGYLLQLLFGGKERHLAKVPVVVIIGRDAG